VVVMTKDEALRLALGALKSKDGWGSSVRDAKEKAIAACEAALEAKDEPVAWIKRSAKGNIYDLLSEPDDGYEPVYTTPPAAQPAPVQEPVGTLNIWFYKGHGNYDFDYWGSLGEGTYTVHVAKSEAPSHNSTCNETLRAQGKPYPRTCKKCGLGPCIGKPKSDTTPPASPVQEPAIKQGWDVDTLLDKPAAQRQWVGLTDESVVSAAARVLSDRVAASCNVDCGDMWMLHGNDSIEDARAMLEAAEAKLKENT